MIFPSQSKRQALIVLLDVLTIIDQPLLICPSPTQGTVQKVSRNTKRLLKYKMVILQQQYLKTTLTTKELMESQTISSVFTVHKQGIGLTSKQLKLFNIFLSKHILSALNIFHAQASQKYFY